MKKLKTTRIKSDKQRFEKANKKQLLKKDKSDKQSWDKAITSLCEKINNKKQYYTTSSCAGRIILIKAAETKKPGLFLFRTHEKISLNQIKKHLENIIKKYKGLVYFKQEACGLHVACLSLEAAQKLIDKAKFTGWKRSGIMATRKRTMCEMMSTENLSLPITNKGNILVNEKFLKILAQEANKKLQRTKEKIKKLEKLINS
jgi:tRNA wybutosine-synthesizing protein 3